MTNEHHGGCLCGAVRFTVSRALRGVIHCHCGQCLKTHGHVAAYTNVLREALCFSREDGFYVGTPPPSGRSVDSAASAGRACFTNRTILEP